MTVIHEFSSHLIESSKMAHEMLEKMLSADWLAVDMEFYWRNTYYPQLCLLQVADCQNSIVIDVLSCEISKQDMEVILQKLSQHSCLVFHSGRQDWQIFQQYCGQFPKKIIDIQYAGVYYGLGVHPSLSSLIEEVLRNKKCSVEQCSDWRQRPLTEQQVDYAKSDVEYIARTYEVVSQQLDKKQWQAVQQDSDQSLLQGQKQIPLNELGSQLLGYRKLSFKKQLILQELAIWRELKAQSRNLPVRWICDDRVLLECAEIDDFNSLYTKSKTALKNRVNKSRRQESFALLNPHRQKQIQAIHQKVSQYPDVEIKQKLYQASHKEYLKITNSRQKIINEVKKHMSQLIEQNPMLSPNMIGKKYLVHFLQQPYDNPLMSGWRYYFIGEKLLQLSQQEINQWSETIQYE